MRNASSTYKFAIRQLVNALTISSKAVRAHGDRLTLEEGVISTIQLEWEIFITIIQYTRVGVFPLQGATYVVITIPAYGKASWITACFGCSTIIIRNDHLKRYKRN